MMRAWWEARTLDGCDVTDRAPEPDDEDTCARSHASTTHRPAVPEMRGRKYRPQGIRDARGR